MIQLGLWDAKKQRSINSQLEVSRCKDGGYDVRHTLSGLLAWSFLPTFVSEADVWLFCDMMAEIDLDAWFLAGRPFNDDTDTLLRIGQVHREWKQKMFAGRLVLSNDIWRDRSVRP